MWLMDKKSSPGIEHGPRRNLPLRSFSLCSDRKVMNAVNEIERFEKDSFLPLFKNREGLLWKSCDGVSIGDNKDKVFYSYSTDTDSGAFSRLSSPDRDSDDSDWSDSSIVSIHQRNRKHSETYSDEDIDECLKKVSLSALEDLQIHIKFKEKL